MHTYTDTHTNAHNTQAYTAIHDYTHAYKYNVTHGEMLAQTCMHMCRYKQYTNMHMHKDRL